MRLNMIEVRDRFNAARAARQHERRERLDALAKLEATLKPNPQYLRRKFAQWGPERIARYERNIALAYNP